MTTILTLEIEANPDTCLRKNSTTDPRTKARHIKTLKEFGKTAMNNALIQRPELVQVLASHRLELIYTIAWEQSRRTKRKQWDGESALLGTAGITDGIVQAVNQNLIAQGEEGVSGINDRDFTFAPVNQIIDPANGAGYVVVEIVSLGEIERETEPVALGRCQATTRTGARCSLPAKVVISTDDASDVACCHRHASIFTRGNGFSVDVWRANAS